MKISYRTHPFLEYLQTDIPQFKVGGETNEIEFFKQNQEQILHWHQLHWSSLREGFCSNIDLISKPFVEAIAIAHPKLVEAKLYKELAHDFGVLVRDRMAICYDLHRRNDLRNGDGGIFGTLFVYMDDHLHLFCTPQKTFYVSGYLQRVLKMDAFTVQKNLMWIVQSYLLFKKFSDIQIKYLKPKQTLKTISCKYINESALSVNYIDCRWFTTLVKSDAFKVRGHFRLQPKKKDGKWTKEIIWINDFMKEGYTAPARKLSHT